MSKMTGSADRLAALEDALAQLQTDIDDTNQRIAVERSDLAALARTIYTQPSSLLVLVAQSGSLGEVMTRTSDLVVARQRAQSIQDRLSADLAALQADQARQQKVHEQEAQVQQALADTLDQVTLLQDRGDQIGATLDQVIADIQDELDAIQDQDPALAQSIANSLRAQEQAIAAEAQKQFSHLVQAWNRIPTGSSGGRSNLLSHGRFIWPVDRPVISQGFGPSGYSFEPPYGGYAHFHTGIDFAAPLGTPVLAAASGVVEQVISDSTGYGNYVVVRHDGRFTTLYAHLSLPLVRVGDSINQGQWIGLLGSTGNSTGPHVHFEVRLDNVPVDPAYYLPSGDSS